MPEYDNTYAIESTIGNVPITVWITLQNLRLTLSNYMHNHVTHEVLYVLSGSATLVYREGELKLKPHTLCLVPSGLYHHIGSRDSDLRIASFRFAIKQRSASGEMNRVIRLLETAKPFVFSLERLPFYEMLMDIFLADTMRPPLMYQDIFKAEVSLILCHVFDQMILLNHDASPEILSSAHLANEQNTIELIEHMLSERYMEKLTLEDVALTINMSKSYTQRLIKTLYGISFSQKLTETRLIMSQSLMRDTHEPLYIIAEKCGYNSYDHFSKSFKARYGITPEKYRKSMMLPGSGMPGRPESLAGSLLTSCAGCMEEPPTPSAKRDS